MITKDSFHSSVAADLIDYISLKQALGRSFYSASIILSYLDRFLCDLGSPPADLTAVTFRQWCQTMESVSSNTRLARMHIVRNFCLYRRRSVSGCFVPDPSQFPKASPRAGPYTFSDTEVAKLLYHTNSIPVLVRSPLRASTTRLAIVLLYTTGVRRGELLRLTRADYNPLERTLTAYMGHVSVLSTYYYMRWIEPLASVASSLFAARYGALIQEGLEGDVP